MDYSSPEPQFVRTPAFLKEEKTTPQNFLVRQYHKHTSDTD